MSSKKEPYNLTLSAIEELHGKLDIIINSVKALEQRIMDVESAVVQINAPSLPPKPGLALQAEYVEAGRPEETRIYDQVELAPVLPERQRGKHFSIQQCDFIQAELLEIKDYVEESKAKSSAKDHKIKTRGTINSLVSLFSVPS